MTAHKYYKCGPIEAEQFDGTREMARKYGIELYSESGYGYEAVEGEESGDGYVIETLEGYFLIRLGDWIATGVDGEHWPIADDIFRKTYVPLPRVPQAVADFIKECKSDHSTFAYAFDSAPWVDDCWLAKDSQHQDTFIAAWLAWPNVEIEEEENETR